MSVRLVSRIRQKPRNIGVSSPSPCGRCENTVATSQPLETRSFSNVGGSRVDEPSSSPVSSSPAPAESLLDPIDSSVVATTIDSRERRLKLFDVISRHIEQGNARAAEQLLRHVDNSKIDHPILLYNRILIGYADSNQLYHLKRVFAMLIKDPNLPNPDEFSYNVYLKALPLQEANSLLKAMMKRKVAQTTSFNTLISGYCREGRPNEAAQVLKLMMKYDREDVKPDLLSFSPIIKILGRKGKPREAESLFVAMRERCGIEPDMIAWSSLLHAWAISKFPEAPDRVNEWLTSIHTPDTAIYNSALLAYANAENRADEAVEILNDMEKKGVPPNIISYSTVLLAWKNSPDVPGAVQQAERLLQEMQELRGLQPNVVLWSTLICIYGREGLVDKAEEVLYTRMTTSPNVVSYAAVLDAWSRSGRTDAYERAMALVQSMKVSPNITTFNTLIKVIEKCSSVTNKIEAIKDVRKLMDDHQSKLNVRTYNAIFAACGVNSQDDSNAAISYIGETLTEMRFASSSKKNIDSYTYPSIFKALANLEAPFDVVQSVFKLCIEDHAFDRMVVSHLLRSCSKDEMQRLLPMVKDVTNFQMTEVPVRWIRRQDYADKLSKKGR